jgi:bifunctional ADP-heptose synthase (sugar kinase/adenylyltransferase)
VSYLNQNIVSEKISNKIYSYFKKESKDLNLIVFSDFNYGCISNYLINKILPFVNQRNLISVADSQSSSQIGDISRFTNMSLITPTEREARVSLNNNEDGLIVLAEKLRKKSNSKNIFLKLGKEGLLIHSYDEKKHMYFNDRIPSLNPVPVDVNGAGDSMMIVGSMALACGANIWEAALLGSLASSVQVGRIGNKPLNKHELRSIINKNIP